MLSKSIKILIADDLTLLLEDLAETIHSQPDMEVVGTATNGKDILELAAAVPHDFILMDIEMEHMTAGIDATEKIRERNKAEKIVYLTAHETKDMILTAMGTGAVDYIIKGTPDEEVLNHIRNLNQGNSIMEERIQNLVLHEYKRLQQSEKGLLFFVNHLADLTKAEKELIALLLEGNKVKQIASERNVEVVTIKSQINKLLKKLGAKRTKEIIKTIHQFNLSHLFVK